MTLDELHALVAAVESATGRDEDGLIFGNSTTGGLAEHQANGRLIALAPDLARLVAEMGELIQYVRDGMCGHISDECIERTDAALVKIAELDQSQEQDA